MELRWLMILEQALSSCTRRVLPYGVISWQKDERAHKHERTRDNDPINKGDSCCLLGSLAPYCNNGKCHLSFGRGKNPNHKISIFILLTYTWTFHPRECYETAFEFCYLLSLLCGVLKIKGLFNAFKIFIFFAPLFIYFLFNSCFSFYIPTTVHLASPHPALLSLDITTHPLLRNVRPPMENHQSSPCYIKA